LEYINFEHNETAAELVRAAYDTPPLAFVHSYGCQQNVNDGERIKGVLVDIGYGLCDKPEDADLILFNTCAVREHAEQRVFGNVGALKGLKEKKRGLMIGLCGCMAEHALLGVLTHGAGVEEDEVCILGLIAQAVADIHQHALDALAIVDVLLTAIAVYKGQRRGVVSRTHQLRSRLVVFKVNVFQ
jgi:hypothetical protein